MNTTMKKQTFLCLAAMLTISLATLMSCSSDEKKGGALVRVNGDRCSQQGIVTRCSLYQRYTTEEALQEAAKSYGGLTPKPFLSPG
jgi:hypothetical protein